MNFGFDLDKIFINFPPIIPDKVVDFLYKGKANHQLKYRIPSKIEQKIRIITHHPLFRQPITENIDFVRNLALNKKNKHYLISSRFSFLKQRTDNLIKSHRFDKIFDFMYFNYENKQPHQFKHEVMKKLNLDIYVDDDLHLLRYLIDRNPKTKFYWLNKSVKKTLGKNLFAIKRLSEILKQNN